MDSLCEETSWNFDPKASFDATASTAVSSDLYRKIMSLELEVLSLRAQLQEKEGNTSASSVSDPVNSTLLLGQAAPQIVISAAVPGDGAAALECSDRACFLVVSRGTQTSHTAHVASAVQTDISSSGGSVVRSVASYSSSGGEQQWVGNPTPLAIAGPMGSLSGEGRSVTRISSVSSTRSK